MSESASEARLPPAFADLERFAPKWCLASEPERYAERMASSMEEMQEFYDACFPRVEEAIDYCDKFPLDDVPEGTLLKVVETGFDALPPARRAEAYRGNEGGWTGQMEAIQKHMEKVP